MDPDSAHLLARNLLVLDFSQAEAGPLATLVLADFGARVIKLERYPEGDLVRKDWGHEVNGFRLPFATLNRGKQSLCLDVRAPEGRKIVEALLTRADVLVHNFRVGVMERLGFGYEELRERLPRLVYAEATGFGTTGPWADRGGQDILAQALGGAMWQNAPEGGRPFPVGYPVADFAAGMSLLTGILMALLSRERTGLGAKVSTSLLEALLFSMLQEVAEARAGHRLMQGGDPVCGVFRAKDGFLSVMPIWRPDAVSNFLSVLELDDLKSDARMIDESARRSNPEWVKGVVEDRLSTQSVSYWLARLDEKGVLCAPVLGLDNLDRHEQIKTVMPFVSMRRSDGDVIGTGVRSPIQVDGRAPTAETVPALGEHTRPILRELGYTSTEIDGLVEDRVVLAI